ncbi:MAG: hypothetical protein L3J82_00030 [Planctomycetes bacterium]|nr:hypothetical protein [Planctomycetota bacterium]
MAEIEESDRINAKLELPHDLGSWYIDERILVEKKDKREDLWLFGARPTVLVVLGGHTQVLRLNTKNKASNKKNSEKLSKLFSEINKYAESNKERYDVVVVSDIFGDDDRKSAFKLFSEIKSELVNLLELGSLARWDNHFGNYWNNYIDRPTHKMVENKDNQPSALASWVWMPTVGTIEAWGVWGIESEMARLEKFEKANKPHDALKIKNKEYAEIAKMLARWDLEEAEKKLEKLEKSDNSEDIKAAVKLRDFESSLEKAYRGKMAGKQKEAGYLIEYAEAMILLANKYYSKSSTRGKAILKEFKEFKKSDEYKHIAKAKKEYQKLRDTINTQVGSGIHGEAYQKKYTKVLKRNKKRIEDFNKKYGDTPYSEQPKRWAESLK